MAEDHIRISIDEIKEEMRVREEARARRWPDTDAALRELFQLHERLRAMGWRDVMFAPRNTEIHVIEFGSTGIHVARKDEQGRFWIGDDGDLWPSDPIAFRQLDWSDDDGVYRPDHPKCCARAADPREER